MSWILYFLMYWSAGLTLKMGDDLLDDLDRPNLAWFPLALSGLLFGVIMSLSEWDLALLTAIVIGVLLTGKVNKPQFVIGFVLIGVVLAIRGVPNVINWANWLALVMALLLAAAFDERGHDWADMKQNSRARFFFRYRFTLKCAVLLSALVWPSFFPTALGMWILDFGYEVAGGIMRRMPVSNHEAQVSSRHP